MRETIKNILRNDTKLISLLGGVTKELQRVYSVASKFEEFPRIVICELYVEPEGEADNEALAQNGMYRVTLYTKTKAYTEIVKRIKTVLQENFLNSVIKVGADEMEKDTKVFSKTVTIEILF